MRDVIDGNEVSGKEQDIQEVRNAWKAYELRQDADPYDLSQLQKVHAIMMDGLVDEFGRFRKGEEGVFESGQCIFIAPPARFVPQFMEDLFFWMKENRRAVHPLILSSIFHYEFAFIHPFSDGNGWMARLWQRALLETWDPLFQFISLESAIAQHQQDYYAAIAASHRTGQSTLFIEFMLEMIELSIEDELEDMKKGTS